MRFNVRAFILGFAVCALATCAYASSGIRYAAFNGTKVIYEGQVLNLNGKRLLSVAKDKERHASNYMPVRAVFEAMGYNVSWSETDKTVLITGTAAPAQAPQISIERYPETPSVAEAPSTARASSAFGSSIPKRSFETPAGLTARESESFKLITEMMVSEMSETSGLASIVLIAAGTPVTTETERKVLSEALYDAIEKALAEGSKKVLDVIQKPSAASSPDYIAAYGKFAAYAAALDTMLSYLKNGELESAYGGFDAAVEIYLGF